MSKRVIIIGSVMLLMCLYGTSGAPVYSPHDKNVNGAGVTPVAPSVSLEDLKDRDPDKVVLDDLSKDFIWDVPEPLVVNVQSIEALPFEPESVHPSIIDFTPEKPRYVPWRWPRPDVEFRWAVIPEPSTWALMILGFGLTGTLIRHQRHQRSVN